MADVVSSTTTWQVKNSLSLLMENFRVQMPFVVGFKSGIVPALNHYSAVVHEHIFNGTSVLNSGRSLVVP